MRPVNPHKRGDAVRSICKDCGVPFDYTYQGRFKIYCPSCGKTRVKRSMKANAVALHLKEGEVRALEGIALCSQEEAAKKLAFWEACEELLKGKEEVVVKPLSQQRIQTIERSAILKIRRALGEEWEAFKEQLGRKGGGEGCHNPQARIPRGVDQDQIY